MIFEKSTFSLNTFVVQKRYYPKRCSGKVPSFLPLPKRMTSRLNNLHYFHMLHYFYSSICFSLFDSSSLYNFIFYFFKQPLTKATRLFADRLFFFHEYGMHFTMIFPLLMKSICLPLPIYYFYIPGCIWNGSI